MKTVLNKADYEEIRSRINSLSVTNKRHWGKMDAHQMLHHCIDSFRMALGEKDSEYNSSKFAKFIVKTFTLSPVNFPKNSPTAPELVKTTAIDVSEFEDSKNTLLQYLDKFIETDLNFKSHYPAFGNMNRVEYGKFFYKHLDHHLRQFGV